MLSELCPPSLVYLAFSLIQIIIDITKNMYNTALMKFIFMIVFTLLLNILCQSGLTIISWILVFVPFIMMTVITSLLLYIFGLSPYKGTLTYPNLNDINNDKNNKRINPRISSNINNTKHNTTTIDTKYSKINNINNDINNIIKSNQLNDVNVDPSRLQENTRDINNVTIDDVSKISKFSKFPTLPS